MSKISEEFPYKYKNIHTVYCEISGENEPATSMLIFLNHNNEKRYCGKYNYNPIEFTINDFVFYINSIDFKSSTSNNDGPLDYFVLSKIEYLKNAKNKMVLRGFLWS